MPRPRRSNLQTFTLGLSLLLALRGGSAEEAPADAATPPADAAPAVRAPLEERSSEETIGLERQLPLAEQQTLKAGADEFLALWKAANVGEPYGVVILVPGEGESADWPSVVGPLRGKLPDAGWASLSLSLPDPQEIPPPPRSADSAAPPEGAGDKPAEGAASQPATPDPAAPAGDAPNATTGETPPIDLDALRKAHAERVLARLDAAVAFGKSRQATRTVLLGHGSGAYWAARYLEERKPAGLTDLLLVAAATPPGFTPVLEDFVVDPKLAIGDFYYKDVPTDRDSALKRMQTSKREKHPAYVQVALKALPGNRDIEQEQLFRRIKGWLNPTPQAPGQP